MVRLSTWMPFRPASRELAFFTGVQVAEATLGGEWKEVKTVALGVVNEPVEERGAQVVHSRELTYFSPTSSCLAQRTSPPRRSATSVQTGPVPAVAEAPTTRIENRRGKQGASLPEP